jgi:hypothetical protein
LFHCHITTYPPPPRPHHVSPLRPPFQQQDVPDGRGNPCSGHGRCLSMWRLGLEAQDEFGVSKPVTYGDADDALSHPKFWDRDMVQGCHCDSRNDMQPYDGPVGLISGIQVMLLFNIIRCLCCPYLCLSLALLSFSVTWRCVIAEVIMYPIILSCRNLLIFLNSSVADATLTITRRLRMRH